MSNTNTLQEALAFANHRFSYQKEIEISKNELHQNMNIAYSGGMFTASRELISFVELSIRCGRDTIVLLDNSELPVSIADTKHFLEQLMDTHFNSMNVYMRRITDLKRKRNITAFVLT